MRHHVRPLHLACILSTVVLLGAGCTNGTSSTLNNDGVGVTENDRIAAGTTISRSDALSQYWYQIARKVNGTAPIEAYSFDSGNTYTLDADISYGFVDALYNGAGDALTFTAEIDSDGTATGTDDFGNMWDFTLDMESPIVEDAVQSWATENGYTIE